ncbi:MAG: glycosyltransferase family 2 protein [Holophagae bacterium]|jgi:GT2 family glycosyltransferase
MKVSLIVVCHHSSRVIATCLESFRRESLAAGVESEVVAVEHSEDAAESRRVAETGVDRLLEQPNRGYAAGLNAGAAEARGEVLLLANPDISFFPGSLAVLLAGVEQGFDVVGPQFVWDDDGSVLLPAAEDPAPYSELGRALRRRSPRAWSATLDRTLDDTWKLWTATETLPAAALRGALLTVPRQALARFGPFDEGYFLYYEETEWLWRARGRGARLGLAAGARVQHRFGHATGRSDDAAAHEKISRRRFFSRNYGWMWRRLLRASGGGSRRQPFTLTYLDDEASIPEHPSDLWLASPFPHLMPALGVVDALALPTPFLEFCRTWRWVVASAERRDSTWRVAGAWTWGR